MFRKLLRFVSFLLIFLLLLQPVAVQAAEEPIDRMAHFRELVGQDAILAALYEADIASLRKAIDLRLVSCEELTAYYLERIEAYNDDYNCFITMCTDALEKARECDRKLAEGTAKGTLFGIPIVVKDNIHYKGYLTTNGYPKSESTVSTTNAKVLQCLLNEGAIVLAKSNMSTAAGAAVTSHSLAAGETKNAYCTYVASGGSSGGSAVATSLNFAASGLGTDTNSSLRYPAAVNGCIALRVTMNGLSYEGLEVLNHVRDVPGAITRTVYDQALMLDAMSGGSTHYTENLNADAIQGLRFGIVTQLTYANSYHYQYTKQNMDSQVAAAFQNAVEELKALGAEVVEVSVPQAFNMTSYTIAAKNSASQREYYAQLKSIMNDADVDALIFPTYLTAPVLSGRDNNGVNHSASSQTLLQNCSYIAPSARMPEITVPIGLHSRGAGIGMEITALWDQEQLLLDIAYTYTNHYDHRITPQDTPELHEGSYTLPALFDLYDRFINCTDEFPALLSSGLSLEQMFAFHQAYQQGQTLEDDLPTVTFRMPKLFAMSVPDPNKPVQTEDPFPYWVLGIPLGLALIGLTVTVILIRKKRRQKKKAPCRN